ncbi:MAG: chemotaxis protein CheW [Bauldia sp.]
MDFNSRDQSLICRLRTCLCSLPLESVVETLRPLPIEPVVGAPDFVLGLSIIRGAPIPVVDVSRLLSGRSSPPARLVVVKAGERRVAMAVDGIIGIRPIAADQLRDLPPLLRDAGADVVSAVGTLDAEFFMVLRASRILPDGLLEGGNAERLAS